MAYRSAQTGEAAAMTESGQTEYRAAIHIGRHPWLRGTGTALIMAAALIACSSCGDNGTRLKTGQTPERVIPAKTDSDNYVDTAIQRIGEFYKGEEAEEMRGLYAAQRHMPPEHRKRLLVTYTGAEAEIVRGLGGVSGVRKILPWVNLDSEGGLKNLSDSDRIVLVNRYYKRGFPF